MYYVYIISIERKDLADESSACYLSSAVQSDSGDEFLDEDIASTRLWTIGRKYDEFFTLEEKLREFHGNSVRLGLLPDKKVFRAKNRSFMDAHRPFFERFLQSLLQQSSLKRSELLYTFLTDENELLDNGVLSMPDLNPLKAMRRVPNKLSRERGQCLKPFVLNILANILAPRSSLYTSTTSPNMADVSLPVSMRRTLSDAGFDINEY